MVRIEEMMLQVIVITKLILKLTALGRTKTTNLIFYTKFQEWHFSLTLK